MLVSKKQKNTRQNEQNRKQTQQILQNSYIQTSTYIYCFILKLLTLSLSGTKRLFLGVAVAPGGAQAPSTAPQQAVLRVLMPAPG